MNKRHTNHFQTAQRLTKKIRILRKLGSMVNLAATNSYQNVVITFIMSQLLTICKSGIATKSQSNSLKLVYSRQMKYGFQRWNQCGMQSVSHLSRRTRFSRDYKNFDELINYERSTRLQTEIYLLLKS